MKRFRTPQETAAYLQARGIPGLPGSGALGTPGARTRALGDYSNDDPNVGNPPALGYGDKAYTGVTTEGLLVRTQAPAPIVANRNSFTLYPFSLSSADGSQQILPTNSRRGSLLVQNQSEADTLYFNLGVAAAEFIGVQLLPGAGIIFDQFCPYNSVSVFYASADPQPGIVMEGAQMT